MKDVNCAENFLRIGQLIRHLNVLKCDNLAHQHVFTVHHNVFVPPAHAHSLRTSLLCSISAKPSPIVTQSIVSSARPRAMTTSSSMHIQGDSIRNTIVNHSRATSALDVFPSRFINETGTVARRLQAISSKEQNATELKGEAIRSMPEEKPHSLTTLTTLTSADQPSCDIAARDSTYHWNQDGEPSLSEPSLNLEIRSDNSEIEKSAKEAVLVQDESLIDGHDAEEWPEISRGQSRSPDSDDCAGGLSLESLVDCLLSEPMSKSDAKFASIFLCLYRKFAAPAELLSAILRRFESLGPRNESQLIRIGEQLRHLGVLAQWIAEYPGDFAHPLTRKRITEFVTQISHNRIFSVAAKEMGTHLDEIVEDDDTEWACSDTRRGRASTLESYSSVPSMRNAVAAILADQAASDVERNSQTSFETAKLTSDLARHSKSPSAASSSDRSESQPGTLTSMLDTSFSAAQWDAERLVPNARISLTKIQWHQFMDFGNEEIARELTRIDWIMYSSIRPRDLIRHVSLPLEERERCKSLDHVNRMVDHFNHVAFWVANIILLRNKPKHRSRALEKFMDIAWVRFIQFI